VGDFHSILRYDPCAIVSEGVCYEQSFKWIDMSTSYFEDYHGHRTRTLTLNLNPDPKP